VRGKNSLILRYIILLCRSGLRVSLEPHGGCGDDLDVEIGEADRGVLVQSRSRDAVHPTHAARPAGCWAPNKQACEANIPVPNMFLRLLMPPGATLGQLFIAEETAACHRNAGGARREAAAEGTIAIVREFGINEAVAQDAQSNPHPATRHHRRRRQ
jgi:hypothetical protein